jgi:hypothetical protein
MSSPSFFKLLIGCNSRMSGTVVGGVALAFHTEARYTKDIDFLIVAEDLKRMGAILESAGFKERAVPRLFPTAG